jgi:probable HAF family extracellular repeat protein
MVGLGALPGYIGSHAGGQGPAGAISGDGSTIVGNAYDANVREAFIHSQPGGLRSLGGLIPPTAEGFDSVATSASFDGSIVAGYGTNLGGNTEAFRWTEATGMVGLGALLGNTLSEAFEISADGSTIVGFSSGSGITQAVVWRAATGIQALGVTGSAKAISSDGKVIGGEGLEAFRWDEETGVVGLGRLPGASRSGVLGISADGSVIVGHSGGFPDRDRAFIWTADAGMQDLQQLLIDEYGLGPSLAGWNLWAPQDISADGQFIVGIGHNPNGALEAWLVRLPVPEPASALLLLLGPLFLVAFRRRRET